MTKTHKGQTTLFIIWGIVIIIAFGFVFYMARLRNANLFQRDYVGAALKEKTFSIIESYVRDCLELTAVEGAFMIAKHGGYYRLPFKYVETDKAKVPHYYYKGTDLRPAKERLEQEFADYIVAELSNCIDFESFEKQGYEISESPKKAEVDFAKNDVVVTLDYPLVIKIGDSSKKIDKFRYRLPLKFDYVYSVFNEIVYSIIKEPEYKDLTMLVSFDYDVFVVPINETTDVYIISTYNHGIEQKRERYNFMFAVER